ncbi:MAG: outer membrane protein transport protein [Pedobacter sp.]|nr:outer membrane protein transport protein [Pedobacter sp.]
MNTQKKVSGFAIKALALAMTALSSQAFAQGYQIDEQSARRLGDAFSGGAAEARDASTTHYNPAGLVRLKQTELTGGVSVLTTKVEFTGTAITFDPSDTSGSGTGNAPVIGNGAESSSSDAVPNLYFATPLREGTVLGIALNAPFASSTDYGSSSVVRYQSLESEVTGARLTLSLGQEISPAFSVGLGLIVQRMEGSITNAIDSASYCSIGSAMSGGVLPTCGTAGTPDQDGRVKYEGDDIAFGYSLGLLYNLNDSTRLGFAYRSAIKNELEGSASVQIPAAVEPVTSMVSPFLSTHSESAKFDLTTPESLSLSAFHQLNEKFNLQADVTWTRWSRFEALDIKTASGEGDVTQEENWKNNWRVAVGGEYQTTEQLALRAGLAWDQSPVPDESRNISFPLDDFKAISIGLTYAFSPALALDAGLQKTLDFDSDVNDGDVNTSYSQANGNSESSTWSAAVGLNWKI